jgi:hypothetical protein
MINIEEPIQELTPAYRLLVKEALNWEYGSIHSHKEVGNILGLTPGTDLYYYAVSKAKKVLLTHGKLIDSIRDIGYQTLMPDDYNPHSVKVVNQGKKKVRIAVQVLSNAPEEQMTDHAKTARRKLYDRTVSLETEMNKRIVGLERLTRKPAITVRNTTRESCEEDLAPVDTI